MLLYFVLLLENVFHSQYIPYVSYFHIYVFLFCDDELYMLKSNKLLFCSVPNVHKCADCLAFLSNFLIYIIALLHNL